MNEQHPFLKPLTALLHSESRLRVWSVVISIFGDAVQPRGGRIAMRDLQDISGRMGIEGNALRTAMSRLAKEDWVVREKQGRNSFYSLSQAGQKTFIPATERIYQLPSGQAHSTSERTWTVAIPSPGQKPAEGGVMLKGATLFQGLSDKTKSVLTSNEYLLVSGQFQSVPDWVKKIAAPAELSTRYAQLAETITRCMQADNADIHPLDALAARCLIIHHWRRIVLRHTVLPPEVKPINWPGDNCAILVAKSYQHLIAPSEAWWAEPTDATGSAELTGRFP
ncbi:MAG: PaaX family transcriptional regulator C-terminal domain-containing protein [Pikeienuella sp.]